jgi:hypothetical protein
MHILAQFQKEIISLTFTLVSAGILYFFRARAKLVWGTPYGFTFLVQDVLATPAGQDGAPQTSPAQATTRRQLIQCVLSSSFKAAAFS